MSPPALHLLMEFEDLEGQTINHGTFFVCVLFVGRLWLRLGPAGSSGRARRPAELLDRVKAATPPVLQLWRHYLVLQTGCGIHKPCNPNMSLTRLYGLMVR